MSRLSMVGVEDGPSPRRIDLSAPILRSHRRRPLHPETIHDLLRERAALRTVTLGPTPYGWKVLLFPEDGGRVVARETGHDATYLEARALRDDEMGTGDYHKAWIVQKDEP